MKTSTILLLAAGAGVAFFAWRHYKRKAVATAATEATGSPAPEPGASAFLINENANELVLG